MLDFLRMLEEQRHNQAQTRNQRLSALRTFYRFLAVQHSEMLLEAERIEAIPAKRTKVPQTFYLERDEIDQLFKALPAGGALALRDRALLMLLYNVGARVQEIADLRVGDVDLGGPLRVRLHGKGDKWRCCPIWPATATLLKQLDTVLSGKNEAPLFTSIRHQALTRFGIYKIVKERTRALIRTGASKDRGGVSPHAIRHSTAVGLLEAGVDVNVIRAWLGHVSLDTTNRYAEITMRTKQAALDICLPPSSSTTTLPASIGWRKDQELMKWLQSL